MYNRIKIDKHIAIPVSSRYKYPFESMEIGDSFLFPGTLRNPHACVTQARKLYPSKNFLLKNTPEGYRVWRVAQGVNGNLVGVTH